MYVETGVGMHMHTHTHHTNYRNTHISYTTNYNTYVRSCMYVNRVRMLGSTYTYIGILYIYCKV